MDKRATSGRGEPIPSILKKPKSRHKGDLVDKSTKIKREKVEGSKKAGDVSAPLQQGCSPLMYACQQADYKAVVDILNKDPASVRVRDRGLRCALHYCASSGAGASQAARAACADRVLMAAPALANARDADGLTPLHLAVVHGNVPLVQTLLAAGADVNARDDEHHTVVHWATVCGEVGALRAVLAAGADAATSDQHGGYPLHYAAQMCGAPAATDHQSRGAALEVLRALVKEGGASVDVRDADGRTPLLWAASAGSAAAVLALHQAGSKVDDADRDGLTALHCAAARGHTEALETLVGLCGARVDVADSHGCTPLHYAAALGHADSTSALLQHGADSHRQDRRGRSPAHTAAAKGQIETVRILGARGANLWLRNSKGDLPLHEAVASGRRELVKWLLDGRPSQVNATNHEGRTPLHIAAATDNADLCRLLLDRGAEVNLVARSSKNEPLTPLDCATTRGHRSTAKYLQMHGGLPASKLANTEIVIDGAPITALPTRKVTSTKIDVRDRIRIEKREVVEISSPVQERRRIKNRNDSDSSNESYTDNRNRKKSDSHRYRDNNHKERRKRLMHTQKSFSDGYDSEFEGYEREDSRDNKHKSSKKNRSKSEPSRRHKRSAKPRQRYRSRSDSSSDSDSYSEKRRSRRHHRRSKRKSSSPSDSSSSESSERRSTKRKGKKTSIHIENDERKQSVNIVKYNTENVQSNEKDENLVVDTEPKIEGTKSEAEKDESILIKNVAHSETETDTLSVKTNMITTEAQIHMERQSSQHGNSELNVTVDSSNNVSIETSNLSVTHKDLTEEAKTRTENLEIKESEKEAIEEPAAESPSVEKQIPPSGPANESSTTDKENALSEGKEMQYSNISENDKTEEKKSDGQEKTATDKEKPADDEKNNQTEGLEHIPPVEQSSKENSPRSNDNIKSSSPEVELTRRKSFQVLSGPDEKLMLSKDLSGDLKTSCDIPSIEQTETQEKSNSPIVSFSNKDEIIESKESNNKAEHLMGESVDHSFDPETDKQIQDSILQKDSSESNIISSEERRKEFSSTTGSSTENQNYDKGLVSVLDDNLSSSRAVQQVILENLSEEFDVNLSLPQTSPKRIRKSSRESQGSSRKSSIYETESYKVLSDIASAPDVTTGILKKTSVKLDDGSMEGDRELFDADKPTKEGYMGRVPSVSDNELYSHSEANGRRKRFRKKGRTKSRTTIRSKSENSERGYESSGLMDSGFEPSPRAIQRQITSPRLAAYYQQRNATGKYSGKSDSRIPVRKPGDKNAVDMKSVTQRIQTNMRRYYCERKIFQHLLELKRLQIRTSKTNEAVLVKRAIDEYNKSSLANVGLGPYNTPDYSFSSFEKFLYESLRKLQKSGKKHLDKLPERPIDFDYGESELYKMSAIPDNPCLCTSKTHRCFHAVHAYTGIPCSAYIPYKWNHHTMPKPATPGGAKSKGFLPKINSKPPSGTAKAHVTLEVSHGTEKQLIALPAEKLDKNKRYYVTFTVKGSEPTSDNDNSSPSATLNTKSVRTG
ncbi:protein phosphatase 1 regulatory subunit 12A isoform X2 [Trichoplusia ni]|uniref:Protein phosphatase 1 regulatory subunit 12A isoform X2 n=2 Tax=Trichoplusia ni TaxID=7111 RepID=A0A7E5W217_TRINI|nr:protein phosphatase 1 regulatory subunit 12A isoform X2 [Trichoplusia ni]